MRYPRGNVSYYYRFVMFQPDGSIYAVRHRTIDGALDFIDAAYGPVHHREVRTKYLPRFDYDRGTGEWLLSLGSEVRTLDEEQVRAIEEQNT